MTGLLCITVRQPWASLIAAGVKTIETRPGPPAGEMCPPGVRPLPAARAARGQRIGIHAGKRGASLEDAPAGWEALGRTAGVDGYEAWHNAAAHPDYFDPDGPVWPFGAMVATAVLANCAPIGGPYSFRTGTVQGDEGDYPGRAVVVHHKASGIGLDRPYLCIDDPNGPPYHVDITDQLPLGDFTPGRWAWLLDDIQPTTARCPACWGTGVTPWEALTPEQQAAWAGPAANLSACVTCEGLGLCVPVHATGRLGLWPWSPGVSR